MDVFKLHRLLISDYASYIHSFINIKDQRMNQYVKKSMEEGLLWPENGAGACKSADFGRVLKLKQKRQKRGRPEEKYWFLMRCELDAAYFHLYGISADDAAYIMDTFPIVKRKDESAHGTYRTKEKILEIYHQMAEAINSGKPYETQLSPPPAYPSIAHAVQKQTKPGSPEMEV